MEDQRLADNSGSAVQVHGSNQGSERSEPVRSRWSPKPEQILILESIFNSGMVNPPKDETVRIRKMLEKFGSVGDANVFYWFQNRRSRSRRRQRQIAAGDRQVPVANKAGDAVQIKHGAIHYDPSPSYSSYSASGAASCSSSSSSAGDSVLGGGFSASPTCDDPVDLFSITQNLGFPEIEQTNLVNPILCPSEPSNIQYQSGFITVFINGVPSEIPRGPINMRAVFGKDVILVHSSGEPVHVDEYGISLQSLQMGESYFLAYGHQLGCCTTYEECNFYPTPRGPRSSPAGGLSLLNRRTSSY